MTVLDFILQSLGKAAEFNSHDMVAPRAVLWTDAERVWEPVIDQVRAAAPRLWTLGAYAPGQRTGPAAFLRYVIDQTKPGESIPVLYLPGVARSEFRSATSLPGSAMHLFAVQFEGQFWAQRNGKDWTPLALLAGADGLALDVAQDAATRAALIECAAQLLKTDIAELKGRRIEAADLHGLVIGDPARMMLQWIGDPTGRKQAWQGTEWAAFCALCSEKFGFNAEKDGVLAAAEHLARGKGPWQEVWRRFKEAPTRFAGVKVQLERVVPESLFGGDPCQEAYPSQNRREEHALRDAMLALQALSPDMAAVRIKELVDRHARRAGWVWAELGDAPLASSLTHLEALLANADLAGLPHSWADLAAMYHDRAWLVDTSALRALAEVREPAERQAVCAAVRALYLPWLEKCAAHVQQRAADYPCRQPSEARLLPVEAGTVYLFVDGLRYDLGRRLALKLRDKKLGVGETHEWAALPTVTATGKPAWRPMSESLNAADSRGGFATAESGSHKTLTADRFRALLTARGFHLLQWDEPADSTRCAWVEVGELDKKGHEEGAQLAWRVAEQLELIAARVQQLIAAGWKKVRVVTDHGWLLMPGGLPKVDLPKHLTESRWGRCALPEPEAKHGFPQVPWFWDASQPIALAPGVACFLSGQEYSHGGLSLQECLLPVLTVTRADPAEGAAGLKLVSLQWKNLRLVAKLEGATGLRMDLRERASEAATSWLSQDHRLRPVKDDGSVSVLVEDDAKLGAGGQLVLVNQAGEVVFKRSVVVGDS